MTTTKAQELAEAYAAEKYGKDDIAVTDFLAGYNAASEDLESKLADAYKAIKRLSECHLPMKPCKGEDLTQKMLEENCNIAKNFLTALSQEKETPHE